MGRNEILLVPVAFTSDHIETLYELDEEYLKEAKEEVGILLYLLVGEGSLIHFTEQLGLTGVKRSESLNADPLFIRALANIAADHLRSGETVSTQMMLRCPGCTNTKCEESKKWFKEQERKV